MKLKSPRFTSPDVIALWGGGNAVLWFIHLGYGGGTVPTFPLAAYGSSVMLVELTAVAGFWTLKRHGDTRFISPGPRSSRIAVWGAAFLGIVVIGLVFRPYMMIPAIYPALGILLEFSASRRARRSAVEGAPQPATAPAVSGQEVRPEAAAALAERHRPLH